MHNFTSPASSENNDLKLQFLETVLRPLVLRRNAYGSLSSAYVTFYNSTQGQEYAVLTTTTCDFEFKMTAIMTTFDAATNKFRPTAVATADGVLLKRAFINTRLGYKSSLFVSNLNCKIKNQHIGSSMICEALKLARAENLEYLNLISATPAEGFYNNLGFECADQFLLRMIKKVDSPLNTNQIATSQTIELDLTSPDLGLNDDNFELNLLNKPSQNEKSLYKENENEKI